MTDAYRHLAETWLAYRDGPGPGFFDSVSWQQVCDAENAVRGILEGTPAPPPQPVDGRLVTLQEENERLRGVVDELTAEIRELHETRRMTPTAAVLDVSQTLAYRNAAEHAPTDPIHAYRAGMLYVAQLIARLTTQRK